MHRYRIAITGNVDGVVGQLRFSDGSTRLVAPYTKSVTWAARDPLVSIVFFNTADSNVAIFQTRGMVDMNRLGRCVNVPSEISTSVNVLANC